MDTRPIGVFDSGLGGLTVVHEIVKLLPNEDVVYLGDTARVPYGTRSAETVKKFSVQDANFLLSKDVKCIVIACNTSSAYAAKLLKQKIKIPVFDVVSSAMAKREKERVGVIGTRGTIASGAYAVPYSKACPLLVSFIEEGQTEDRALGLVVKDYLRELRGKKIHTLILGCTHYPIISDLIQKEIGEKVKLINPGKLVAKDLKEVLIRRKMLNENRTEGKRFYFVTDLTPRFVKVAEMFLGEKIGGKIRKVDIE